MTPRSSGVECAQHGVLDVHRRGEKENPKSAASSVRGGGPGRDAAGGGGHGEAGQGEGNTPTLCSTPETGSLGDS